MKKVISLIILSIMIMMFTASVYASDVLDDGPTTITGNEYENAQQNNVSDEEATLPQTGTESFALGMVLIACVASAAFAYKKVSDYRGI